MAEHVMTINDTEAECTCGFKSDVYNFPKVITPLVVTQHIQDNEIDIVVYDLRDNKG